ncbi:MAG: hypothetical protein E7620_04755 [Ruminococcaceae bacterium]|nr:hypothetical protein [Oscillospiraceae bacterium]
MKKLQFIALFLIAVLMLTCVPAFAEETVTDVKIGSSGRSITEAGTYRLSYEESITAGKYLRIAAEGADVTLILDNVDITNTVNCIAVYNSNVTVQLVGTNKMAITGTGVAGGIVLMDTTSTLTIEGDGSLEILSGAYNPCIGLVQNLKNTTNPLITVNSGTLNLTTGGNANGAALGGGRYSSADVVINGGVVNASSKANAAAIGGGREASSMSNVTINGGIVTATSLQNGSAIGAAFKANANVTINGGVINAYSPHKAVKAIDVKGMNMTDSGTLTINGGAIYAYNNGSAAVEDYSSDTVKKLTVAVPAGATAPYAVAVNGVEATYHALNTGDVLNIYAKTAASYTLEANNMLAKTTASVAAGDWAAPSADLVYVGYQEADRGTTRDVRFVAALKNHEAYASVGFTVMINGDAVKLFEGESTTIYSSLNGTDEQGAAFVAATAEQYTADGLFAAVLRNLPETGSYTLTVVASAANEAGAEVFSAAYTYTVANGVLTIVD